LSNILCPQYYFRVAGDALRARYKKSVSHSGLAIYLCRKVVCFVSFCNYEIHQTRMLQIMFLVFLESSRQGGVHGLGSTAFGLAVQKFLSIE